MLNDDIGLVRTFFLKIVVNPAYTIDKSDIRIRKQAYLLYDRCKSVVNPFCVINLYKKENQCISQTLQAGVLKGYCIGMTVSQYYKQFF